MDVVAERPDVLDLAKVRLSVESSKEALSAGRDWLQNWASPAGWGEPLEWLEETITQAIDKLDEIQQTLETVRRVNRVQLILA